MAAMETEERRKNSKNFDRNKKSSARGKVTTTGEGGKTYGRSENKNRDTFWAVLGLC